MNLYGDHLVLDNGIQHQRYNDLQARNFNPSYESLRVVPSESNDHAYLVGKVTTLTKPLSEADVAADKITVILCGCDHHYYRCSSGIETDASPESIDTCKHGVAAYREVRAQNDQAQVTL